MPFIYEQQVSGGSGGSGSSESGSSGGSTVIVREINTQTTIQNGRHVPVNLKEKYTASELLAEINKGAASEIYPGDYYPVTIGGTFHDYATDTDKTLNNVSVRLEVAAIDPYLYYGDEGEFAAGTKHVVFTCHAALPIVLQMRSANSTWFDKTTNNPWTGSALYKTLNDSTNGLIRLFKQTEIGPYIYTGSDNSGMRHVMETKAANVSSASGMHWGNRGALFFPTEKEIWGSSMYSNNRFGSGGAVQQWPIFALAGDYTSKTLGEGSSPCNYWCESSVDNSFTAFCRGAARNFPYTGEAGTDNAGIVPCFIVCGRGE